MSIFVCKTCNVDFKCAQALGAHYNKKPTHMTRAVKRARLARAYKANISRTKKDTVVPNSLTGSTASPKLKAKACTRALGNAVVYGNALVSGNTGVCGIARVSGNALVSGNATAGVVNFCPHCGLRLASIRNAISGD